MSEFRIAQQNTVLQQDLQGYLFQQSIILMWLILVVILQIQMIVRHTVQWKHKIWKISSTLIMFSEKQYHDKNNNKKSNSPTTVTVTSLDHALVFCLFFP